MVLDISKVVIEGIILIKIKILLLKNMIIIQILLGHIHPEVIIHKEHIQDMVNQVKWLNQLILKWISKWVNSNNHLFLKGIQVTLTLSNPKCQCITVKDKEEVCNLEVRLKDEVIFFWKILIWKVYTSIKDGKHINKIWRIK